MWSPALVKIGLVRLTICFAINLLAGMKKAQMVNANDREEVCRTVAEELFDADNLAVSFKRFLYWRRS